MLYDIVMTALIVGLTAGSIWTTLKINKAVKEGRIRYLGKVRIERQRKVSNGNDDQGSIVR